MEKSNNKRVCNVFLCMGKVCLCFFGTLAILFALLVSSAKIPNYKIHENIWDSAAYLVESEAEFYQWKAGDRRTEIHNYADATTLNILYSVNGGNILRKSVISPFYSDRVNQEKSMTELLVERIRLERPADTMYDRYWHGMILVLKPLFVFFTLQQIRWIFLGTLIACLGVLTLLLVHRKQYFMSCLLWLGALAVQTWMAGFCIEYYPVFLITFLISIFMVLKAEKRERIIELCVVSGVCVAFFDFLTTETLAVVIPLACVYSIWRSKGTLRSVKEELVFLTRAGIGWAGAYVSTYLAKWTLSSIACKEERFSAALSQLAGRQGNDVVSFAADSLRSNGIPAEAMQNAGGNILPQFLSAVVINIRLFLGLSGKISLEQLALLLVIIGLFIAAVVYLFRKPGRMEAFSVVMLLLGTIPLFRMMVLNNHSIEHCFFVYRSLYGTVICYVAGIGYMLDRELLRRRKKDGVKRTKKQR